MGFLMVNLDFKLVQGEKTHNQGLNISPRSKFLDELAISKNLFFTILPQISFNIFSLIVFRSPSYGGSPPLYSPS